MAFSRGWAAALGACVVGFAASVGAQDGIVPWQLRPPIVTDDFRDFDVGAIVRGQQAEAEEEEAGTIETDRPDFTEASSVVPLGMLQLESGYTFVYDDNRDDDTITRGHSGPEMLLRYGATELAELRLVWNYLWESTSEGGATIRRDGADDLTFGTKVFLLAQESWIPEASIIFDMSAPTGGRSFTNRNCEFGTNLLYGWDLPRDFTLGASTGYSTATDVGDPGGPAPTEDRHNLFHQSVTVGQPWTERLRSYTEYFGLYYDGLVGGRPQHYLDGGFTYLVNDNTQLDIRAGYGLNESADDFFAGVGYSVRK